VCGLEAFYTRVGTCGGESVRGETEEPIAGTGRKEITVWNIGGAVLALNTDGHVLSLMDNCKNEQLICACQGGKGSKKRNELN